MSKKPEDVLRAWMRAVNTGELETLLALYDEKAVLIPTFSHRVLSTPEQIRAYFEKLGSREDLSVALHDKTLLVDPLEKDLCALCGIYCWRFILDGELLSFEARFSLIMDIALPRPILHHHSSQIPRSL